jgi:sulfur-oxidizing protein SoxY
MNSTRRTALQQGSSLTVLTLAIAAGLIKPAAAQTAGWNKAAFEAKDLAGVLKALDGAMPIESKDITLNAPEIAENGAVVPVGASSSIPKTEQISILIEKNPNMLAAMFNMLADTEPNVSTRVKMGQTSDVFALVKADGKYYFAKKEIKVTLGGCGG